MAPLKSTTVHLLLYLHGIRMSYSRNLSVSKTVAEAQQMLCQLAHVVRLVILIPWGGGKRGVSHVVGGQ